MSSQNVPEDQIRLEFGTDTTDYEFGALSDSVADLTLRAERSVSRPMPFGEIALLVKFVAASVASGIVYDVLKKATERLIRRFQDDDEIQRDLIVLIPLLDCKIICRKEDLMLEKRGRKTGLRSVEQIWEIIPQPSNDA